MCSKHQWRNVIESVGSVRTCKSFFHLQVCIAPQSSVALIYNDVRVTIRPIDSKEYQS